MVNTHSQFGLGALKAPTVDYSPLLEQTRASLR